MTKLCKVCGTYPVTSKGPLKQRAVCNACYKKPYTRHKKESCEECGFVPVHRCQLDVDHVDGSKANCSPTNLRTLCANCHRLKTFLAKDFDKNEARAAPRCLETPPSYPSPHLTRSLT